jgi:hypothetical protein
MDDSEIMIRLGVSNVEMAVGMYVCTQPSAGTRQQRAEIAVNTAYVYQHFKILMGFGIQQAVIRSYMISTALAYFQPHCLWLQKLS